MWYLFLSDPNFTYADISDARLDKTKQDRTRQDNKTKKMWKNAKMRKITKHKTRQATQQNEKMRQKMPTMQKTKQDKTI